MFDLPSLKIVFRKKRSNKQGEAPLYLQYIQNRKSHLISLKKKMPVDCWKGDLKEYFFEKGENYHPLSEQVNLYLRQILFQAEEIIMQHQISKTPISFEDFKAKLFEGSNKGVSFEEVADRYINKRIGEGSKKLTVISHNSKKNKVLEYKKNLQITEINEKWIEHYESYLRLELKNKLNTIAKDMLFIKAVCKMAKDEKLIREDPFSNYKIKRTTPTPSSLTTEEVKTLRKLYNAEALRSSLQKVLKRFLWSCYTGMDFQDTNHFKFEDISKINGEWVISFSRLKTGVPYIVPVSKKAKKLISLKKNKSGLVFGKISNQKANDYLREILKIASIQKRITFHSARHTFGTNAINDGIPREIVKRMMGHSKNDMTDHYARLTASTIISTSLKVWNK
jgi:site-specific recombinase XerD